MKLTFDHPCKETCSGWKQGYEAGARYAAGKSAERIKELEAGLMSIKLDSMDKINQLLSLKDTQGEG